MGVACFSDGDKPIWNTELLLKALQYTSDINVPIFQNARDIHLSANTYMHEGTCSTSLGLRGEPSFSEELIILRDIEVLKYSGGGALHFSRISTANSVELIRKAKQSGLSVTCDVGIHHLLFTDESIADFNTNFKNFPHYRSEKDRKALIKGLKEGTIDAICSNHRPLDEDSKQLEFDLAKPGNISLQTFFPSLLEVSREVPLDTLIDAVVSGPRKVLRMDTGGIELGNKAKLTVFDPDGHWILNEETNFSKSNNSPFLGKNLRGMVIGTINGDNAEIRNV